jgi:Family of unknown function (DUF6289)
MFKRTAIVAVAFATATLFATATPTHAIPTGNTLTVFAYYSDAAKTHLVGQKWSGCGQPSGQWGVTTSIFTVFFPAC